MPPVWCGGVAPRDGHSVSRTRISRTEYSPSFGFRPGNLWPGRVADQCMSICKEAAHVSGQRCCTVAFLATMQSGHCSREGASSTNNATKGRYDRQRLLLPRACSAARPAGLYLWDAWARCMRKASGTPKWRPTLSRWVLVGGLPQSPPWARRRWHRRQMVERTRRMG